MAPVYLTAPNNAALSSAFRERKLVTRRPVEASDVMVAGFPGIILLTIPDSILIDLGGASVMSDLVFSNFAMWAWAQKTGTPLIGELAFYAVLQGFNATFGHIHPPVGIFAFPALNNAQKEELGSMGLEQEGNLWRGIPQSHHIGRLLSLGAHNARQIPGRASADAFVAYVMAMKMMQIFSTMSFSRRSTDYAILYDPTSASTFDLSQHTQIGSCIKPSGGYKRTMTLRTQADAQMLVVPSDAKGPLVRPIIEAEGFPNYSLTPSSAASISGPGLLFPYFRDMMLPDRNFSASVIQRFFYRCLGKDSTVAHQFWVKIKSGLRNLAMLPAGMALSHAFLGMMLADQSKNTIRYIIQNGIYFGFVLLGPGHIVLDNTVYDPVDTATLREDFNVLTSFDTHLSALVTLLRQPNTIQPDGTVKVVYDISVSTVNTSRKLFNVLRSIDIDEHFPTEVPTIQDLINKLTFGEPYAPPSLANIQSFLSYCSSGEDSILQSFPTLLSDQVWRSGSRIAVGLAIFGPTAPTISWGSRNKSIVYTLPRHDAVDTFFDPSGQNVRSTMIQLVPFGAALSGWTQVLTQFIIAIPLDPKKSKQDLKIPDRRGVSATFTEGTHKALMTQVINVANEHRAANEGKRKRGLEDDDPAVKKRKAAEAMMDLGADF